MDRLIVSVRVWMYVRKDEKEFGVCWLVSVCVCVHPAKRREREREEQCLAE